MVAYILIPLVLKSRSLVLLYTLWNPITEKWKAPRGTNANCEPLQANIKCRHIFQEVRLVVFSWGMPPSLTDGFARHRV